MFKKLLNFWNKDISNIHSAAYVLGIFTLVSQIIAIVRDRILAFQFGASSTLDIYYAAFRIPDFIFISVASIVSVTVLIPILSEKFSHQENDARQFLNNIFSFFFIFIASFSFLVFILMPYITKFIFPGFDKESLDTLSSVARIMLLQPIFLGLSNMLASITQIKKKFLIYGLSPILYNIGIIFGIIFLYPVLGLYGMAIGVVFGAFLHLAVQIPFIKSIGFWPKLKFNFHFSDIKKVVATSIPRTIALAANSIALIFLLGLASSMTEGSISVFNFSLNLQSVPLAIIGASYFLVAFPVLSKYFSKKDFKSLFELISLSAKRIIFWSLPAIVLFIVLRAQIVRIVLGSGQFDWSDTRLTAAALAIFSFSVIAQSLMLLFIRSFYAIGDTTKPLIINVFSSLFIAISAFGFRELFNGSEIFRFFIESLFRVDDISGAVILVLPMAFSLGVLLNSVFLLIFLKIDLKGLKLKARRTFFNTFSSSVLMGFTTYLFLNIMSKYVDIDTFIGIFTQGLVSALVGILVFILSLKLLKEEQYLEIEGTFKKNFKRLLIR